MVLSDEASKILIEKFPDLKESEYWEDCSSIEYKEDENSLKLFGLMTILGRYIKDILNAPMNIEKRKEVEKVFSLVEFFMNQGDQSVRNAAGTCFLENLINYTSWGSLKPETFLCYLGKESKKYCKAWDEFTGVKTEGLWD